ncbi:cutinase family protein [Amycolatopsis saalfeldensis]|uniref:Cutinase n=1 Tax=Amycolatopsis saalfeldensis TaxID=394193 RepID=A0A1H8Y913_9PSEU|nr:cutinase family protein [Amycolatopsis saalfeldensis]SEP48592.1 cutinase [Amycolatopsis saalfeldensis]
MKKKHSSVFRRTGLAVVGSVACLAAAVPATASAAEQPASSSAGASGCADVDFVFARGTGEGGGTIRYLGGQLANDLQAKLPGKNFSAEGLDYPADWAADSPSIGVQNLSDTLNAKVAACPDTKYVIGGYSQGAAVLDEALGADLWWVSGPSLPDEVVSKISAIVTFGNPLTGLPPTGRSTKIGWEVPSLDGRTYEACAILDGVCGNSGTWSGSHLDYYTNGSVPFVADYITGHVS